MSETTQQAQQAQQALAHINKLIASLGAIVGDMRAVSIFAATVRANNDGKGNATIPVSMVDMLEVSIDRIGTNTAALTEYYQASHDRFTALANGVHPSEAPPAQGLGDKPAVREPVPVAPKPQQAPKAPANPAHAPYSAKPALQLSPHEIFSSVDHSPLWNQLGRYIRGETSIFNGAKEFAQDIDMLEVSEWIYLEPGMYYAEGGMGQIKAVILRLNGVGIVWHPQPNSVRLFVAELNKNPDAVGGFNHTWYQHTQLGVTALNSVLTQLRAQIAAL